ncbi:CPBP family intramembrane glutamic endopeptidase [Acetanaerobacterium elongatum]|uniref:CAAX prenyl protease 2/Lysostaphin resistance protein A-like domain-containing protein n=1 Tax=Acetanaerobacterium elongatum TaxID=258515 RepID=A0A1G9UNJ1_9FIRM|nr:type II CAAX endopeptidase family protein [Acetanaerobacterium elongatum]SDM61105.1 hypothetical protein SAMN05192585_10261 [Acetanaerobacterium elongatum]
MNRKLILSYLLITFGISYFLWGVVLVLTGLCGMKLESPFCITLYLLGSFGPAFGSYIAQKKVNRIAGFKEFIKKSFRFKSSVFSYLLVVLFLLLYFIFPFFAGQITLGIPVYIALLLVPLMLFGGGMEEVGWRWVLQPELEKKLPFALSAVITSIIWALWHGPLFFIQGSSQSQVEFIPFYLLLVGMSVAQAALFEFSKNVWLSILLHCSFNAFQMAFVFEEKLSTSIIVSLIMIAGTMLIRLFIKKSAYATKTNAEEQHS